MQKKSESVSQIIVNDVLNSNDYLLFTDQFNIPSIVSKESSLVGYAVRSRQFRGEISRLAWFKYEKILNRSVLDSILEAIAGMCSIEGKTMELHNRVACHDENIYYDIGDNKQVVEITPNGWEIKTEAPVIFKRYNHQKEQVIPDKDGDVVDILRFFNLKNEEQKILLITYLPVCLLPHINHPLILIHGSQGSGKSTALSFIRSLIDPSAIALLSPTGQTDEFIRQASHNYCFFLDNISGISAQISDVFCRLVTGMSFGKRELFTDDEDILYSFKRVTGFNGVAQFANKPDLLDRSLILQLERIKGSERKKELDILADFEKSKPKLLGGLFSLVSTLLKTKGELDLSDLPRMADYYEFAASAAVALGYTVSDFVSAYKTNTSTQHQESINASIVATLILEFMSNRKDWSGSSSYLFTLLKEKAIDQGLNSGFPRDPNWLWRKIQEVKPELEAVGVLAEKDDSARPRKIILTKLNSFVKPLDVPKLSSESNEDTFPSDVRGTFCVGEDGQIHPTNNKSKSNEAEG